MNCLKILMKILLIIKNHCLLKVLIEIFQLKGKINNKKSILNNKIILI